MGVATGVFQSANGSPVASGQWQFKLSQDAILVNATAVCIAPRLISGPLDTLGAMTATFAFNDVLSTSSGLTTCYQLTVKDIGGGQVWNECYVLTGTSANINLIPPAGRSGCTGIPLTVTSGGGGLTGTGSANVLAMWTGPSSLGLSNAVDTGSFLEYIIGGTTTTIAQGTFSTTNPTQTVALRAANNNAGAAPDADLVGGASNPANGGQIFARGANLGVGGDVELLGGHGAAGSNTTGNVILSPGNAAQATGAGAIYMTVNGLLVANMPAPPPANVLTGSSIGALLFCPNAKGPQDGATWGSIMSATGTGALCKYTGSNWIVIG